MISKISYFPTHKIYLNNINNYKTNSFQRTPKNDIVSFSASAENKIPNNIKETLDRKVFTLKKDNGELFEGTIKEYFENSIINKVSTKYTNFIHCTPTKEIANNIIENGLDWTKTKRMRLGPGTYFSPSAAGGTEQGGGMVPIEAEYIGNKKEYPVFEQNFYNGILDNQEIKNTVRELLKENTSKYTTEDIIDIYCHDIIEKEMGIDFLYGATGRGVGAYAVYNNDCVKLSKYYW